MEKIATDAFPVGRLHAEGCACAGGAAVPKRFLFSGLVRRWPLFAMLLKNDLSAKFKHSALGVLWLFIPSVSILVVYVYMFSFIFRLSWPDTSCSSRWAFALMVYLAIALYTAFCDSVMGSVAVLTARASMLKRVPFPYELLPVSLTCANMIVAGCVLWLLFALSLASGGGGSAWALAWFPVVFVPFVLWTAGCCILVSALGVFFRDLGNLIAVLLRLFFFATPIFYTLDMVPKSFAWIIRANPLTPFVNAMRAIFLQDARPHWGDVAFAWIAALAFLAAGHLLFNRLRRRFADVV